MNEYGTRVMLLPLLVRSHYCWWLLGMAIATAATAINTFNIITATTHVVATVAMGIVTKVDYH